jgi:protein phosphatase
MNVQCDTDPEGMPAVEDLVTRHFGPRPPAVDVRFGALSHPGRVRTHNEDHYLVAERRRCRTVLLTNLPADVLPPVDDVAYVLAVADGIGGAAFGELASLLALRSAWEQAPSAIKWSWIINDHEIDELRERVELIFQRADQALMERAKQEPACAGMGTTLTGVYTVGPEAFVAHAGDSRVYLYRSGQLTRLTRDHTLAQRCLDEGVPVESRSWYRILTNCLGGREGEVRVEFHHFRLAEGDQLLLCTDGLTDMVSEDQVAGILGRNAPPQQAAQALVDRALECGGKDNVTVVLAHYTLPRPDHLEPGSSRREQS